MFAQEIGVGAVAFAVDLGGKRHSAGGGYAQTQRAGGHINAGSSLHIGMSLQIGVSLTQSQQILLREIAFFRQHRVKRRGGVSL